MAFNWPAGLTCWSFLGLEPPERLRGHDAPGDRHVAEAEVCNKKTSAGQVSGFRGLPAAVALGYLYLRIFYLTVAMMTCPSREAPRI